MTILIHRCVHHGSLDKCQELRNAIRFWHVSMPEAQLFSACLILISNFPRLYGLTGGGFVSLLPTLTADLVGIRNLSRGLGMCYMSAMWGTLLGTPLAGILSDRAGYTACIEFAGAMTITSSLIILILRQRRSKGVIFCKI